MVLLSPTYNRIKWVRVPTGALMNNLYNVNGLIFWSEEEIRLRNVFVEHMVSSIRRKLFSLNSAFKIVQCEAPLITPKNLLNSSYNINEDVFGISNENVLRPETTMGSYAYANYLLKEHTEEKLKLPFCIWQHGKSFRKEQDQPTKHMRLKEFYQLEFQVLFSSNTFNDYYPHLVEEVTKSLSFFLPNCKTEKSDRLPDYSTETTDVIYDGMEICSISRRKDFSENIKNVEIAIGTDRCVYNAMKKN